MLMMDNSVVTEADYQAVAMFITYVLVSKFIYTYINVQQQMKMKIILHYKI